MDCTVFTKLYCRIGVDVACGEMSRGRKRQEDACQDLCENWEVAWFLAAGFHCVLEWALDAWTDVACGGQRFIKGHVLRGHTRAILPKGRVSRVACPKSTNFSSRHQPQFYSILARFCPHTGTTKNGRNPVTPHRLTLCTFWPPRS